MKPIQQAILRLLQDRPYTGRELHKHFNNGDEGITRDWMGKESWSRLQAWLNRHIRPLIRDKKVRREGNQYWITEQGRKALGLIGAFIMDESTDDKAKIEMILNQHQVPRNG